MKYRITLAVFLIVIGVSTSAISSVDNWEGGYCWNSGNPNYVRLPFTTALMKTWHEILNFDSKFFALVIVFHTAFIWGALSTLITRSLTINASAFLLLIAPFVLTVHDHIFAFDAFCDGHGEAELGFIAIQLLFVLPIGLTLLIAAMLSKLIGRIRSIQMR